MFLSQRITVEQKQKLVMTPKLQQAIKLLQFSSLELNEYIEQEVNTNPVLEVEQEKPKEEELKMEDREAFEEHLAYDDYSPGYDCGYAGGSKDEITYENFISEAPTLSEYLLDQFKLLTQDDEEQAIGEYLIDSLDDRGFLTIPLEEVSEHFEVEEKEIVKIVKMIQTLDPVGIGATDLIDSLLIQAREIYGDQPLVEKIIRDHLEQLGQNKIKKIAKKLKKSPAEVQRAADLITTLNPSPAADFSTDHNTKFLEPDIFIHQVGDEYVVEMNDKITPRLIISRYYQNLLKRSAEEDTQEFLEKKINSALWLIKCIEQRRMTIYQIVNTLVEMQEPFLNKGVKYLQPMTLNEVAEKIEVHESTVSRATDNKYVQTPHGIYELKFFFNSGISGKGEGLASVSVKQIIQELIETENATKPLSDRKIADIIKDKGYSISRRTVAKYRGELGIPSSSKRRRYA